METRPWSDLPLELLELILSKLPPLDHPYFACVCKNWRRITAPLVVYPAEDRPLLLYLKNVSGDRSLYFYSPSFNKTFRVNRPFDVPDSIFHFSRDGWLALYREVSEDEAEVVLANPITGTLHEFPGLSPTHGAVAFSGRPPDDCVIFAVESRSPDRVLIRFWDNRGGWRSFEASNGRRFVVAPDTSPVVRGDSFVCLGEGGNIGVYDHRENSWNVLGRPGRFGVSNYEVRDRYLVEREGELLAVLIGRRNSPAEVLRLDERAMRWDRVASLGPQNLFVGPQVSISASLSVEGAGNVVFRSRFLGLPETIEAELRTSGGRIVFVPKGPPCRGLEEASMDATRRCIFTYDLLSGRRSRCIDGSFEYPFSIWYDTKAARKLCPSSSSHQGMKIL